MTPADKQEPVAWMYERGGKVLFSHAESDDMRAGWTETPLYTRPTSDLAERIEGLVEEIVRAAREADSATEAEDTVATILAALKEVNSHDRT